MNTDNKRIIHDKESFEPAEIKIITFETVSIDIAGGAGSTPVEDL